jgi:hypothetical protein
MPRAITQHYWGVQPITPAARPRREGQAQQLQDYVDAQKRAKRVQVLPRTEITEQEQTQALVECMDAWGYPIMWAAIIGVLVLILVNHYGWAIVPMAGALVGLRGIWGRLWGNAE